MTNLKSAIPCFICDSPLTLGLCRPSRTGKRTLHIRCPTDGRHLRGFIAHQPLMDEVLDQLQKIAGEETSPPTAASQ